MKQYYRICWKDEKEEVHKQRDFIWTKEQAEFLIKEYPIPGFKYWIEAKSVGMKKGVG